MRAFRVSPALLTPLVLLAMLLQALCTGPAFAADMGLSKAEFLKRFNAASGPAGLPPLPSKPMQEDKKQDAVGPLTLSVYAIGPLVVMLQTYDSKPSTVASAAVLNQIGGPADNDKATAIAADSLIRTVLPKANLGAVKKALGLDKGIQGAVADGKKREHVAGGIRFVSGARAGKGITIAAYPAQR